ncbi:hypothetical protein ACIBH1_05470 [Nonomuraea sp. NPDC050663]|uniref:phage tail tube protein n=1 Tax=Nonomuraea sp. NPDC050663 TaxID=3364370 RepID=UPI0037A2FDBA
MADEDLLGDGMYKVTICTALSSVSSPPAAELNAGVDIQACMMREGLQIEPSQEGADNSSLANKGPTRRAGTPSYTINLLCKKKKLTIEDIAFNTLVPGQDVILAVRRNRPNAEAWQAGDPAEIYPVQCGVRKPQQTAWNEVQKFLSELFNHSDADIDAVVV